MSKHTPGPWKQGKTTPENVSAGSALICRTFARSRFSDEEIANARLIAAAPELLEALREMVNAWGSGFESGESPSLDKAHAAIAKATGQEET